MSGGFLSHESRLFLQEKIGFEDGIDHHLDKLQVHDAKENCYKKGDNRYWSDFGSFGVSKSSEAELQLKRETDGSVKLHYIPFDYIIEESQFCLSDIVYGGHKNFYGIAAMGCM